MIMRRDFISGIAASIPAIGFSRPVNSMLGAIGTDKVVDDGPMPTAADYSQDGLIALYDGIENAGVNRHSDIASLWTDLTGNGYNLTVNGDRAAWSSTALYRTASVRKDYSWTNYMAYRTSSIPQCQSYECVFSREKYTEDGADGECIVNPYPTAWQTTVLRVFNNRVSAGRNRDAGRGAPYVPIEDGVIYSASAAFSGSGSTKYPTRLIVNGTSFSAGQTVNSSSYVRTSGFCIGENQWSAKTTYFTFWGSVHCIRIYNRVITEEEIEHNLLIDRVRFNLP